jgi:hypothetical protein
VRSIRRTMRRGLADRIRIATDHELVEQDWLRATEDFKEGIQSTAERRPAKFVGRSVPFTPERRDRRASRTSVAAHGVGLVRRF